MVADDANSEVSPETQAPEDRQRSDEGAADRPTRAACGIKKREQAKGVSPGDVDDPVVVHAPGDEVNSGEQRAKSGEREGDEGEWAHGIGCSGWSVAALAAASALRRVTVRMMGNVIR